MIYFEKNYYFPIIRANLNRRTMLVAKTHGRFRNQDPLKPPLSRFNDTEMAPLSLAERGDFNG